MTDIVEELQKAKILIGAQMDGLPPVQREVRVNQAWHALNNIESRLSNIIAHIRKYIDGECTLDAMEAALEDAYGDADTIASLRAELETVNLEAKVYAIAATEHGEMRLAAEARAEAAESANAALVGALEDMKNAALVGALEDMTNAALVGALDDMKKKFLMGHECRPLDHTNDRQRFWCAAMDKAEAALSNAPAQAKLMAAVVEAGIKMHSNWTAITELEFCDAVDAYIAALRGSNQP